MVNSPNKSLPLLTLEEVTSSVLDMTRYRFCWASILSTR